MKTKVENSMIPELQSTDSYGILIIQYTPEEPSSRIALESWRSHLKETTVIPLGESSDRQVLYVCCPSESDFSVILQTIHGLLQDTLTQATWIPVSDAYRIRDGHSVVQVEPCSTSEIPS